MYISPEEKTQEWKITWCCNAEAHCCKFYGNAHTLIYLLLLFITVPTTPHLTPSPNKRTPTAPILLAFPLWSSHWKRERTIGFHSFGYHLSKVLLIQFAQQFSLRRKWASRWIGHCCVTILPSIARRRNGSGEAATPSDVILVVKAIQGNWPIGTQLGGKDAEKIGNKLEDVCTIAEIA